MRTEPWWCCTCGAKIYRVGKGKGRTKTGGDKWEKHLLICPLNEVKKQHPDKYVCQGMHIKQIPQNGK